MEEATDELREFYNYIWGEEKLGRRATFVYLPVEFEGEFTKYVFEWPRQREAVIKHTLKWSALKANVYFSPALYKASQPIKENVIGSYVLWVDFDGNAPQEWDEEYVEGQPFVPPPTLIVQSSIEGHEHCYWRLDEFVKSIHKLEELNRGIAYLMNADTSGWDADQILRPPRTTNHKRGKPVTIKHWDR